MSLIDPKLMRFAMAMSSATITLGVLMYGAYHFGTILDKKWGTDPFVMFGLLLLALASGAAWIIRVANKTKL